MKQEYKITFISDTHGEHVKITDQLIGGDYLIHSGDISNRGTLNEVKNFLEWFNSLDNYTNKIFIAGNHDFWFEDNNMLSIQTLLKGYPRITYLQDSELITGINGLPSFKIYGSPWQPTFYDWAFNLPRDGKELKDKWSQIPEDTDILVTHGPPLYILDRNKGGLNCGCSILNKEISNRIKPKIHVFGHIHEGYGSVRKKETHYINAAQLDYRNILTNRPVNIEWDPETNELIYKM